MYARTGLGRSDKDRSSDTGTEHGARRAREALRDWARGSAVMFVRACVRVLVDVPSAAERSVLDMVCVSGDGVWTTFACVCLLRRPRSMPSKCAEGCVSPTFANGGKCIKRRASTHVAK